MELSPDHERIFAMLNSAKPGERLAAEMEIQRLGIEGVQLLLLGVEYEAAKLKKRRRLVGGIMAAAYSIAAAAIMVLIATHKEGLIIECAGFAGFSALGLLAARSKEHNRYIETLGTCRSELAIGPLCDSLSAQDRELKFQIIRALYDVLPKMSEATAATLTPRQKTNITGLLAACDPEKEPELMVVLIDASAKLEILAVIPIVERLVKQGPNVNSTELQHSAAMALTVLNEARESGKSAQTLLRPAAGSDQPQHLLRAASTKSEHPAEELLRPRSGQ